MTNVNPDREWKVRNARSTKPTMRHYEFRVHNRSICSVDLSLDADVEELVLELFTLVNEKNELFRRQAELMLLRRQQRLEEEHAEVEYQIRCLMCQPEATKTDFDKQKEEALIQRYFIYNITNAHAYNILNMIVYVNKLSKM